jgi:choline monooxygenase
VTTAASAVPEASTYTDADRYEAERWAIFARQWTAIGAVGQLAAPGAYRLAWVAGYPLVVVDDGGILQAFQNVCRHRAGPLVDEGSGSCGRFVCRYHGWAYALDGRLSGAGDFGAEVDADGFALLPAQVAGWRGLLFVALEPSEPDLEVWLASVNGYSASFPMESFEVTHRSSHDLATNWKVYAENYQEGYHIPLVHPGLNRQIDAVGYEVEIDGAATVHTAPTRDGSVSVGAWLWRFPGFALNLYPSGMCIESFWPTGPTSTRVEYTFCFTPGTPAEEAEMAVASSLAILEEDWGICEAVQRNLASGLARPGVLSPRHESGVALVQTLIADSNKEHHR